MDGECDSTDPCIGLDNDFDGDDDGNSGFNFAYGQRFSWGEVGVGLVSGAHNEDGDEQKKLKKKKNNKY